MTFSQCSLILRRSKVEGVRGRERPGQSENKAILSAACLIMELPVLNSLRQTLLMFLCTAKTGKKENICYNCTLLKRILSEPLRRKMREDSSELNSFSCCRHFTVEGGFPNQFSVYFVPMAKQHSLFIYPESTLSEEC